MKKTRSVRQIPLPIYAKDMTGITEKIVRSYVEAGTAEALYEDYGIREDEARLSLACADLATLPAWDAEALLEAATVYLEHFSYASETEKAASIKRVRRRIRLALMAENSPSFMSPANGVLVLRSAGIDVFHELLGAVALQALEGSEPEKTYRRLKCIPEPEGMKTEPLVVTSATEGPATDNPQAAPESAEAVPIESAMPEACLATRQQILDAFGNWGFKKDWFANLNDRQWLQTARKRIGQGQRGQVVEPLFCPYEVMRGLVNSVRGRRMSEGKGWQVLEHKFPDAYARVSIGDPRERTG